MTIATRKNKSLVEWYFCQGDNHGVFIWFYKESTQVIFSAKNADGEWRAVSNNLDISKEEGIKIVEKEELNGSRIRSHRRL